MRKCGTLFMKYNNSFFKLDNSFKCFITWWSVNCVWYMRFSRSPFKQFWKDSPKGLVLSPDLTTWTAFNSLSEPLYTLGDSEWSADTQCPSLGAFIFPAILMLHLAMGLILAKKKKKKKVSDSDICHSRPEALEAGLQISPLLVVPLQQAMLRMVSSVWFTE